MNQGRLYIKCPNIMASVYCQHKLREVFGFEILGGEPTRTVGFLVLNPPEGCAMLCSEIAEEEKRQRGYYYIATAKEKHKNCPGCLKIKNDKPLILDPGTGKDIEWIEMFTALALINFVTLNVTQLKNS